MRNKEKGQKEKCNIKGERCWWELSVPERIERNMSKWFGHVERQGEKRLVKRVYRGNVERKEWVLAQPPYSP